MSDIDQLGRSMPYGRRRGNVSFLWRRLRDLSTRSEVPWWSGVRWL